MEQSDEPGRMTSAALRPQDPARMRHAYGGIEHASDPPVEGCLMCLLLDAAVVIERMANGASRQECSPELDRVLAHIRREDPR